ncbi:MAG: MFS transporter [Gemmatimonadetes bacterium]|nr:MFS transporter [Gemmatimonadota bacterium]
MTQPPPPPRDVAKVVFSWAMFDWANSAFTTLVVTFIYSTYFTQAIARDAVSGTVLWSRAVAASALLIALVSPIMGALADRGGKRRRYLGVTVAIAVTATAALAFVKPDLDHAILIALTLFVIGNVAFEMGMVFYNAFLPSIASPEKIGRVSGYGWGLGYVGGLVCMVIALVGFVRPEIPWFGISTADGFNVRATNLLVAVWFLIFSLPLFLFVREPAASQTRLDLAGAFRELRHTFRQLRRYREMTKFLLARMIYNDGLVTVFAFGGIYAAGTFDMPLSEVILFGIALNVAAGFGALIFGFVDDKIGGKKTIMLTLAGLCVATIIAVLAPTKTWLWVAGVLIGLFVGPNQSASRSLICRFMPAEHQAEFFGFFAFSGKVTSFLGPILLGTVAAAFDSQRAGVATVIGFFLAGAILLATVSERKGMEAAQSA